MLNLAVLNPVSSLTVLESIAVISNPWLFCFEPHGLQVSLSAQESRVDVIARYPDFFNPNLISSISADAIYLKIGCYSLALIDLLNNSSQFLPRTQNNANIK